jgi:hypothetical protein
MAHTSIPINVHLLLYSQIEESKHTSHNLGHFLFSFGLQTYFKGLSMKRRYLPLPYMGNVLIFFKTMTDFCDTSNINYYINEPVY